MEREPDDGAGYGEPEEEQEGVQWIELSPEDDAPVRGANLGRFTYKLRPSENPEEEPEEPELPSGPTCKYFAPATGLIDTMHASANADWPYDTLFDAHGCAHPGRNRQGRLTCDAYMCMPACQYYEEETDHLVQGKQNDDVQVLLRTRRSGLGIPQYDVVKVQETSEELLASFNNHTEEGTASQKATDAYNKEIEERNLSDAPDIDTSTFEIPSYLKMLVAEHA